MGGAELLYTHGDQCEDDKNYNYSTRIKFRCDETKTTVRYFLFYKLFLIPHWLNMKIREIVGKRGD